MKNFLTGLFFITAIILVFTTESSKAETLEAPLWLQQINTTLDYKVEQNGDTTTLFRAGIKWQNGFIGNQDFSNVGFYVYRARAHKGLQDNEFEKVATIEVTANSEEWITFRDEAQYGGVFAYYVIAFDGELTSPKTRTILAVIPGSYCVRMDAEIVDFISYPVTIGEAGKLYEYEAFAKHRSYRAQGMVEYELVEYPEGMEIHQYTGAIKWQIPTDASGEYYVKIRATSSEDDRAESIQEWYISIALPSESNSETSVLNYTEIDEVNIFPSPASDMVNLTLEFENPSILIEISDVAGNVLISERQNINNGKQTLNIDTSELTTGTYLIRILDGQNIKYAKVVIQ